MTRKTILLAAAALLTFGASAQSNSKYHISDIDIARKGESLSLRMTVDPKKYGLNWNRQLQLTPVVKSKTSEDSIVMKPVSVAGRNAYYNTERSDTHDVILLRSGHGDSFVYQASAPWQEWMEESSVSFKVSSTGCCNSPVAPDVNEPVAEIDYTVQNFTSPDATFHYVTPPTVDKKPRRIEGKAFINFPVNRTEIYPDYMVNPVELRKITSSIDTVRYDSDATVKSITLVGFASPEGPYSNNVRLAKGRTEALMQYVRGQYSFPSKVFMTNSVPEDWEGLREAVKVSSLPDKEAIIGFIDSGYPIEKRNDELQKRFPASYEILLKEVYPSLRHTNYAIDYEIRVYTDINEILKVYEEKPENLSLNEFFLAANHYGVGTEKFDEIMNAAVLHNPTSEVANINAANSAMNEGDFRRAEMLLKRVKESPEAVYSWGLLHALEGNYEAAEKELDKASGLGMTEAAGALAKIKELKKPKTPVRYVE